MKANSLNLRYRWALLPMVALAVATAPSSLLLPPAAWAQEQDGPLQGGQVREEKQEETEEAPAPPPRPGKVVPDGPAMPGLPPVPPGGIGAAPMQGQHSLSRSMINGTTTTKLTTDTEEIAVEESDLGIFIQRTRKYGRGDVEQLRETQPKLAEAIEAFPQHEEGADLELVVKSSQRFEAIDLDELKKQPEAFKLYQTVRDAYEQQGANMAGFNGGFPMQGFGGAPFGQLDAQVQQQLKDAEQRMQQIQQRMQFQMQQMRQNNRGNFQFGF